MKHSKLFIISKAQKKLPLKAQESNSINEQIAQIVYALENLKAKITTSNNNENLQNIVKQLQEENSSLQKENYQLKEIVNALKSENEELKRQYKLMYNRLNKRVWRIRKESGVDIYFNKPKKKKKD